MNRALCIGINSYPASPLSGCVNDANDWAAALAARGYEVSGFIDQSATKKQIMFALEKLIAETRYGEVLVITYSGHGTSIPDESGDERDGRDEALCPFDIDRGELIVDDDLYAAFSRKQRGSRIVLISDSCHSGTVSRLMAPLVRETTENMYRRMRYLPPAYFLNGRRLRAAERFQEARAQVKSPEYGRELSLLLSGCLDTEYSWDAYINGRYNGAFTRVAIDALAGLGEDATYADWHRAVRQRLPSEDFPQTPRLFGPKRMMGWRLFA